MGRYTLVKDGQPIPKFVQVDLSTIDKFTTNFNSYDGLLRNLDKKDVHGFSQLKIYYKANGEQKQLDVAYSDKKDLKNISMTENNKIDENNKVFRQNVDDFIKKIRTDKNFYKFTLSSKLLNIKVKEYVELAAKSNDTFYERKLCQYLGTYSQFRKLLFLLEAYTQYKIKKEAETLFEDKEDSRVRQWFDEDEYYTYTKEELEKYIEYMDSLPETEPDYKR